MTTDGALPAIFQRYLLPHGVSQRIETGSTGRGIPDLAYCIRGAAGWIECKACEAHAVHFRPEQIAFAERWTRAGGRVFGAVRQKSLTQGRDNLWLLPGPALRLTRLGPGCGALGMWSNGPSSWDWPKIIELLTK